MAAKWLELNNTSNRKIVKAHVERIARDMLAGRFRETHQGIAFGVDGSLLDGQHRLSAIVLANTPVYIWVWKGVSNEAWDVMDRGQRPRRVSDMPELRGRSHATVVAAAAKLVCAVETGIGYLNNRNYPTAVEVQEFIKHDPSLIDAVQEVMSAGVFRPLGSVSFQAYCYCVLRGAPERTEFIGFLDQVCERTDRRASSPAALFSRRAVVDGMALKEKEFLFVKAWRAHRDGARLRRLALPKGYRFVSEDFDPR